MRKLVVSELQRGGYDVAYSRVETAGAMAEALAGATWDWWSSPITSFRVFQGPPRSPCCRSRGSNIPFIVISGRIGEELAVSSLKAGPTIS